MKKTLVLFVCTLLLFAERTEAQPAWTWQNPLPQGNIFYDLSFADSMHGWVVGGAGTVLRTTNGGNTWEYSQTPLHELIIRTALISPTHGWALTSASKTLLRTTDGALTWDSISTVPLESYPELCFLNDSIGFVPGFNGNILRTKDGGVTWTSVQAGNPPSYFTTVHFASSLVGWAAGAGGWASKTTDGGLTWTPVNTGGALPATRRIFCLNEQRIYCAGSDEVIADHPFGVLRTSTDGGGTWQVLHGFDQPLLDVYFSSSDTGWVADTYATIFQTTDGGTTWADLPGKGYHFAFGNSHRAWSITASSLIRATTNGWKTFEVQTRAVTENYLWAVSVLDSSRAVACGSNATILATTNSGKTWSSIFWTFEDDWAENFQDILYRSEQEIWAVGQNGKVVHTEDGGKSWSSPAISSLFLSGIAFATDSLGFIIGSLPGTLYRTTDAGASWGVHKNFGDVPLDRIVFSRPSLGWICADDGVYRSTDLGDSWEHVYTSTSLVKDIASVGDRAWFALANNVVFSTDAGATWTSKTVYEVGNAIYYITSLTFADQNNGWAVSESGKIYRTDDGGGSWSLESDVNGNSLYRIRSADRTHAWAVGSGGVILHYQENIMSVADHNADILPYTPVLEQNYPNPFNPTTTIQYGLPYRSHVTLAVFNTLGQQVATLINGEVEAGYHQVTFNAASLASGVYFYRLVTPGVVQTKKLCIIR